VKKSGATIKVTVDGSTWSRVSSFSEAGPNDRVYVLNREGDSLQFGDDTRGLKPAAGSTITVSYRDGTGSAGNISKCIASEKQAGKFWVIATRKSQSVGWGKRPA